ncbi:MULTISPECIES: PSP1 domain-containing protein [Loigolactobacillus]|uniref:Signal peptidase n=1 Tax=Loigolactobacillus backii TaxID=375175 RepID=A0A192H2A6_9LACO|nr:MULTISPECIES: stage 0 sporulation family protein [Loigolactobacillus]ANK59115.1 signal peptidase [Loigolactobacillus backii]ANK62495.1 signal peptidase [Loigolactobacillus backii]ANK64104.1 signal peptidase [Loigolactobacillus backii]ANK67502.1 signal peptidase [Loigolactobacillus backii]ANK70493.1 signal peptidase [Loigolactobacillus backii]
MEVIAIRFRKAEKLAYLENKLRIKVGEAVVVAVDHCEEIARAAQRLELDPSEIVLSNEVIERTASQLDLAHYAQNKVAAVKALRTAREQVMKLHLPMKLDLAYYTLNKHKLIFDFTAAGRVDFRELVRSLAAIFKTRIELRQVGVRDEAKILGGIGPCGRPLCCSEFLGEFAPVSIKMAKNQNLSLNPTKISGLCGRLMCCLSFEDKTYEAEKAAMPDYGSRIETADGGGKVVGMNLLTHVIRVRLDGHEVPVEYDLDEIKV